MPSVIAYIKTRDRPGLLQDVTRSLTGIGANILLSLGYVEDKMAVLLFIIEISREIEDVEGAIRSVVKDPEARIEVSYVGPDAVDILQDFLESRPELAGTLERVLEPPDLHDIILRLSEGAARRALAALSPRTLAWILEIADKQTVEGIVRWVELNRLLQALKELDPDEAVDVLQKIDEQLRRRLLALLPPEYKKQAGALLRYPPDSAGGIMTSSLPVLKGYETAAVALYHLRSGDYDIRDTIAVVDGAGRLLGLVEVSDLLSQPPNARLEDIARRPRVTVSPWEDQETVARLMLRYYLRRLPVVEDDRFLGVIAIEDVAYVLAEEAAEDIAKLVGSEVPVERYVSARIKELVKARLPWLLIIYLIESITANVLKSYEHVIARAAVLAAFIPLIMGTGGNVGSQAVGLIIRALALGEVSERSRSDALLIVRKELATSSIIALAFSLVGLGFAYAVSRSMLVALAVASTLFTVILFADLAGALLPLAARRAGVDPASVSTPLITTIVDVSVAFIYMHIALILLS